MRWSPWLLSDAARGLPPRIDEPVGAGLDRRARAAVSSWCSVADAVALLHRELGRVADLGDAVGERGRDRERRDLVLHVGDLVAFDRRCR